MTNPRLGLYNERFAVPFPRRLMNTAVSANLLNPKEYARLILNLLPNALEAGTGVKRYGTTAKGNEITSQNILKIMEYRTSTGTIEILAYVDDGTIRVLNEGTGAWTTKISGLSANGNPRWVHFNEKLVIVDGINTPMAYNGSTCTAISEYVEDVLCTSETQVDTNTITLVPAAGRSDYEAGQNIKVTFATAGEVSATISSVTGTTTLTIDVSGTPFPSPNESITKVEYEVSPPAFSDIYAEHDMLWALSAGESKADDFRGRQDAMKVYYTSTTNNESSWYNTTTQEVGYVNLLNKSRRFDELVKISSIDGLMVFFGRDSTFIYAGDDPATVGEFVWQKTLPIGCINGNLVQQYPQDVLFFTRYGARSLRTIFQTEGQEIVPDLGTDVDPTVTSYIATMISSDASYRAARSYFYERDGFYGFLFGATYSLAYALSEESKGWVYFSGHFNDANDIYGSTDGRLFLAVGGQLYTYSNGTDGDTSYADGASAIEIRWSTATMNMGGRWSNIGFELVMGDVADTSLDIYRAVDNRDDNLEFVKSVSLTSGGSYWDVAQWDVDNWGSTAKRIIWRDKFYKDSFWISVRNESTAGAISFQALKPIGR